MYSSTCNLDYYWRKYSLIDKGKSVHKFRPAVPFNNKLWLQLCHTTCIVHTTHTHVIILKSKGQLGTFTKQFIWSISVKSISLSRTMQTGKCNSLTLWWNKQFYEKNKTICDFATHQFCTLVVFLHMLGIHLHLPVLNNHR